MDVQSTVNKFDRAFGYCDNIISAQRAHGGEGVGRHYSELSFDRAALVLAVAAWPATAEDLTTTIIDTAACST